MKKKATPYDEWLDARNREAFHIAEVIKWRQKRLNAKKKILFDLVGKDAETLSNREIEVVEMLQRRPPLSNKEIAQKLQISVRTAKAHVSSILRKLGMTSRFSLADTFSGIVSSDHP